MPRKKIDHSHGGAEIGELNQLHAELVQAAREQLQREREAGEVKPQTLNVLRQLLSDSGVQPSRPVADAMERLRTQVDALNIDFSKVTSRYH